MTFATNVLVAVTPLNEIVDTMERRRIKRVPVMRGAQVAAIVLGRPS